MKNTLTKTILEMIDVEALQPDFSVLKILSKDQAEKAQALIFDKDKTTLAILTTNNYPDVLQKILETLAAKKYKTNLYYTDPEAFEKAILWYDQMELQEALEMKKTQEQAKATGRSAEQALQELYAKRDTIDDGQFISEIIKLTFQAWASDLHFQPQVDGVVMRMRKDGVMKQLLTFTHAEFKKYLLKIKFMAGTKMNIDYLPQDGRFDFIVATDAANAAKTAIAVDQVDTTTKKIDVRVSVMPGLRGEGIVMRFLDAQEWYKPFTDIWFSQTHIDILKKQLDQNYGMILVTGPTGSGKTTTLYSMLHYLNQPWKKIITLEDPVEYELPGIEQSQINTTKWYTFEEWLKSVLRHDPDIIMVWEIRNAETAEIAFNAALTGHLVLATVHTNTATEAITRLLNLGIKPYMLAPALNMIIGQRLVRKLHTCETRIDAPLAQSEEVKTVLRGIADVSPRTPQNFTGKLPQAVGCDICQTDWYKWRVAVVELLEMTSDLRNMIIENKSTMELYWALRQWGFLTMKEDAYLKMLDGKTTLDEIRRVL